MGGTYSKATINSLQQSISNIAMTNITKCQTSSNQTQNIRIVNDGFRFWTNYKIEQTSSINSSCVQDTVLQAKLQNDIFNAIKNASSAEGVALLSAFGNTNSSAETNLQTIIQNNVTMENIMENYTKIEQTQNVEIVNNFVWVFDNMSMVQGSQIFAASTLKAMEDAGIFNTISNKLDQSARSKSTNPLDFIANLFGNMAQAVLFVILFIVVIIIAMIYAARSGKTGAHESDILVKIRN